MTTPLSRETPPPSPSRQDRPRVPRGDRAPGRDDGTGPKFALSPALIGVLLALVFLLVPLLFQLQISFAP